MDTLKCLNHFKNKSAVLSAKLTACLVLNERNVQISRIYIAYSCNQFVPVFQKQILQHTFYFSLLVLQKFYWVQQTEFINSMIMTAVNLYVWIKIVKKSTCTTLTRIVYSAKKKTSILFTLFIAALRHFL